MASATPADAQTAQARLAGDATFQALKAKYLDIAAKANAGDAQAYQDALVANAAVNKYLKDHDLLPNDWEYDFNQDTLVKKSWGDRNPLLRAGLLMGGAVAAPLAFSAAGGAAGAGSGAAAGTGVGVGETAATVGLPAARGVTSSLNGGNGSLYSGIIDGIVGLVGTKLATNAAGDATKAQLDALDKATALQKSIYEQSRSDQMPWLQSGRAALGKLNYGLGLDIQDVPTVGTQNAPSASPVSAATPVAPMPSQSAGAPGTPPSGPGTTSMQDLENVPADKGAHQPIQMRTPAGAIITVPAFHVPEAESRGAVRV